MFTDADRIHRINAYIKFGGEEMNTSEVSSSMAAALKKDFPQVEMATRFRNRGSMLIRKVLGASIGQITYKLSIDFLKLVGVAIIISIPLAWYAMNKWLEGFSYRIEIGLGVFFLAVFLAIIISIITLSFQSIKAAIANPIKSLRTE